MKKIFTLFLLAACMAASATVRYAKPAASGTGDGSSWANASDNIDSLSNASAPGDEIWVAQGTYYPTLDLGGENSFNNHFLLKDGVKLYGGFSGNGTETMLSQRDYLHQVTTLFGINYEITENGWSGPSMVNQVVVSLDDGAGTVIDGFTITWGNAVDAGSVFWDPDLGLDGGGMYISNSSVTVSNCTFLDNYAGGVGAGMFIKNASPTITNCTFKGNEASFGGGAICNDNSSPSISHCFFKNNRVSAFDYDGDYEMLHGGGGIYNRNHSSPFVSYCVFDSNRTNSGSGGAIDNYQFSSPVISNCLLADNQSALYGGAVRNEENSAPELVNCTIFRNISAGAGGGIYNQANSHPIIINSILLGNLFNEAEDNIQNSGGGNSTVSFSLIKGSGGSGAGWQTSFGTDGGGNIDAVLLFVDVFDINGADDSLGTADDGLALLPCSPAVNTGSNTNIAATDITGGNRLVGAKVDMGAYESAQTGGNTLYKDADGDGYGDPAISLQGCSVGYVSNNNDCDDSNAEVNPTTVWYKDADNDGYSDGQTINQCAQPAGYRLLSALTAATGDCDDANAAIHPGAADICGNGIDENCSGPITRLYVNRSALAGGSGETWACAIKELRDAVALANNSPSVTEIFVAKGVYKPTAGTDRNASISINRRGLTIVGGFVGNEESMGQSDPLANITTISGDIGVEGNMADNSYHLLRIPAVEVNRYLMIRGLQFDKGNANASNNPSDENAYGGAFLIYNNVPDADIIISSCGFTNNNSNLGGGALRILNSAKPNEYTVINFTSCLFLQNTSAAGGAVESVGSDLSFEECVFKGNKTNVGTGGAVNIIGGEIRFKRSGFVRNVCRTNGGAVFQGQASVLYDNCVFSANRAATGGGAIAQQGGSQTTSSNTFFANTGSLYGGAITRDGASVVRINNNIFWKNAKNGVITGPGADISSGPLTLCSYNMLQAGSGVPADNGSSIVANQRGVNPLFVNEAQPAGADDLLIYQNDGLALSASSPAINSGDPAVYGTWDVQHKLRLQCGAEDKGAYEYQGCPSPSPAAAIVLNGPKQPNVSDIKVTVTNPFVNSLTIYYSGNEKASLNITDLTGKPMQKVMTIQPGPTTVNTSVWASGMYQVAIYTNGQPKVFKVIKLR